ncbi:YiiX/YebB-like N1pC/P60 family cysteine hydrolase [Limibacterium fermenti]|uniref:YiiX/YebB-like N1pC/P60 family cysteine hydrolase n=1 Tax=Limibacterium fermenti TaxID=3229863 RepID=UPI000E87075D|nr:hypothetical protein [Porphyromonadaceae bacterium]HBX44971.1 hypothetical protein [Porphyromonadaceae bacterium]
MTRIRFLFIVCILMFLPACRNQSFVLQEGDLLFTVGKGESELLKAIQNSTSGKQEIPFSHVGIVHIENDKLFVLEATSPQGVVITPLDSFFEETARIDGKSLMAVGRLKEPFRYSIRDAITNAQKHIGKPYDYAYDEDNDAYYCSELVRYAFTDSLGKPLFEPLAMSFKNLETGEIDPYWIQHFERLHTPVPEGAPGTNPADMAKSNLIDIVHTYY